MLTDKELRIISNLREKGGQSQRDLALASDLSLGMTNLLLKRLGNKGYIKIRQLDWNRIQYILTPKGMLEKTRKSIAYAYQTLHQLKLIVGGIRQALLEEYRGGCTAFHIVTDPQARELIEIALNGLDLPEARVCWYAELEEVPSGTEMVFLGKPGAPVNSRARIVPLISWVQSGPERQPRELAVEIA